MSQLTSSADSSVQRVPARPLAARRGGRTITHEEIAGLAFTKWQVRGCPLGDSQRDWFEAENELKAQRRVATRTR